MQPYYWGSIVASPMRFYRQRPSLVHAVLVFFILIGSIRLLRPTSSILSTIHLSPNTPPYKQKSAFNGTWDFQSDSKNFLLSSDQCLSVFPRLYADIDRAVRARAGKRITLEEIDGIPLRNGYVRGIIYDQEVWCVENSPWRVSLSFSIIFRAIACLISIANAPPFHVEL